MDLLKKVPIKEATGRIYGKNQGKGIITATSYKGHEKNMLVFGEKVTNKEKIITPNIITSLKDGDNIIIIENGSCLYKSTALVAEEYGYKKQIINFNDPAKSPGWNIIDEMDASKPLEESTLFITSLLESIDEKTPEKINALNYFRIVLSYVLSSNAFENSKSREKKRDFAAVMEYFTSKGLEDIKESMLKFPPKERKDQEVKEMLNYVDRSKNYLIWNQSSMSETIFTLMDRDIIKLLTEKNTSIEALIKKRQEKTIIYITADERTSFLVDLFMNYYIKKNTKETSVFVDSGLISPNIAYRLMEREPNATLIYSEGLSQLELERYSKYIDCIISITANKILSNCYDIKTAKYFSELSGFALSNNKVDKNETLSYRDIIYLNSTSNLYFTRNGAVLKLEQLTKNDIDVVKKK